MITKLSFHAVAFALFTVTAARADGLVQKLPEDGVSAKFSFEGKVVRGAEENELKGTVVISSVGTVEENGEKCRWIEISFDVLRGKSVIKLLVPEKCVKKGENPLAHVIRGWSKSEEEEIESVTETEKMPFMPAFMGGPLADAKPLESATIENEKLGSVECAGVEGKRSQERDGLVIESRHQLRLTDKAPFGCVGAEVEFVGLRDGREEFKGTYSIKLIDVDKDAKSELPDSK